MLIVRCGCCWSPLVDAYKVQSALQIRAILMIKCCFGQEAGDGIARELPLAALRCLENLVVAAELAVRMAPLPFSPVSGTPRPNACQDAQHPGHLDAQKQAIVNMRHILLGKF